jgi:hypothetical protein
MGIESVQRCGGHVPFVAAFARVSVLLLIFLCTGANPPAQEESGAIPDVEHQRAGAIREPCIPTEEERDPDVFKRPCFTEALAFSRHAFGADAGFRGMNESWLPVAAADRQDGRRQQADLQNLLLNVIRPRYLPGSWQEVPFYQLLACPEIPVTELKVPGGAPTVIGMRVDCAGVDVKKLEALAVAGEWTSNGVEFMPLMSRRWAYPNRAVIRLRLYGDDRLTIRPRPPGDDSNRPGARHSFFDREAFHALLTSVFQVPFATTEDWLVDGRDGEPAGVRVFHGTIRSRDWEMHRRDPGAPAKPPHWWDEMRLLVTESDPQYFCVEIVLRAGDAAPEPEP